jgi:hypothetical protein
VGPHLRELVGGQAAGLEQDAIRDGDLADVVQRSGLAQQRELALGHAERRADAHGQLGDARRVLAGVVVAVLGREREALDDLQLGVLHEQASVLVGERLGRGVRAARAQVEDGEQRRERQDRRGGAAGGEPERARGAVAVLGARAADLASDRALLAGGHEAEGVRLCLATAHLGLADLLQGGHVRPVGPVTRSRPAAGASRRRRRRRVSIRRWAATIRARTAAWPAASSACTPA